MMCIKLLIMAIIVTCVKVHGGGEICLTLVVDSRGTVLYGIVDCNCIVPFLAKEQFAREGGRLGRGP
jgi:hypothetical protein